MQNSKGTEDQAYRLPQDQLALIDLFVLIWHRRWVLAISLITVVIFAAVYLFTADRIYEAKAVLQIGKATANADLENPNDLVGRIFSAYSLWDDSRPYPRIENVVKVSKAGPSRLVEIYAQAKSPLEAEKLLLAVGGAIIEEHRVLHSRIVTAAENRENMLGHFLNSAASQPNLSRQLQSEEMRNQSPGLKPGQFSVPEVINAISLQIPELELIRANPSRYIFQPQAGRTPVWPNKFLILLGALSLGLLCGTLVIFGGELLRHVRIEANKQGGASGSSS